MRSSCPECGHRVRATVDTAFYFSPTLCRGCGACLEVSFGSKLVACALGGTLFVLGLAAMYLSPVEGAWKGLALGFYVLFFFVPLYIIFMRLLIVYRAVTAVKTEGTADKDGGAVSPESSNGTRNDESEAERANDE